MLFSNFIYIYTVVSLFIVYNGFKRITLLRNTIALSNLLKRTSVKSVKNTFHKTNEIDPFRRSGVNNKDILHFDKKVV